MSGELERYGRFASRPVEEDYNQEAREADRERDIYASKRSSRPSYTQPDPPCTECGHYEHKVVVEIVTDPETGERQRVHREVATHGPGADYPDHEYNGTTRIAGVQPGYDKVTFPIMRNNAIKKLHEDDLDTSIGSLWQLQRLIGDAKFELLKQCIAAGVHMISNIEAEVVVEVRARTLTDKAGAVVKVKEGVQRISILQPNGEFKFGGY